MDCSPVCLDYVVERLAGRKAGGEAGRPERIAMYCCETDLSKGP